MSRRRKRHRDENANRPTVDQIETLLGGLGQGLKSETISDLRHADQERFPEWRGADVRVTSDFNWEPRGFMEAHDLLVRTRHALPLSWLLLEVRDAFSVWLDAGNKHDFYGSLAQAALDHLAANQPEADDPRPLLRAVLNRAFSWLQVLSENGFIPGDAQCVLHIQDAESQQRRINLRTGEETL